MERSDEGMAWPLERCEVRLNNDTRALEAAASDRMQVTVERFGDRVRSIRAILPQVKTAFLDDRTKDVRITTTRSIAKINPHGGSGPPYPRSSPDVRIYFPGLSDGLTPWLGGLLWLGRGIAPTGAELPEMLTELMAALAGETERRVGIPCLWRKGEWHLDRDLIFVARQIHRLLTDPGDYSPTDCYNPDAALYWADHKDMLPLEPPIPELYGRSGSNDRRRDR